jgi:integrase
LESSPLAGYAKPKPRERSRVIDADEFQLMLRGSGAPFRRLLLALRLTGARPCELRDLRWQEVHLDIRLGDGDECGGFLILAEHKTVTRQKHPRPRIIPLPPCIRKMLKLLARRKHGPEDHVFLNSEGCPWTRTALHSQIRRLRERMHLKRKGGENIVLYSTRHSFATSKVGRVTDIELADLMGHTDISTTRRYTHVSLERLQEIRRRADQ